MALSTKASSSQPKRLLRAARFRLMPLTMAMLSLLLLAKVNDLYWNSRQLSELLSVRDAKAAESAGKEAPAAAGEEKKEAADASAEAPKSSVAGRRKQGSMVPVEEERTYGAGRLTIKQVEALKAKEKQAPYTQTEVDLLQNLAKRREELDKRAEEIDMKATVLEATEKRINDRVIEMKNLQKELSTIVAEYKNQQNSEIKSLVRIYESMKPTDAAAIFNELDMPILLEVIDKMSERKAAPILAGMTPRKARDVTQELAELRKSRASLSSLANEVTGAPQQ